MSETIGPCPGLRGVSAAVQRAADAAAIAGGWLAALCIAALTLLVLTDTLLAAISRQIPAVPSGTGIGWEYSAYFMGAAFLLGSGLTLRAGLQLRVEIVISSVGDRIRWVMELFSALLGSAITVALTLWLVRFTLRTWGYGEVSADSSTPLWIPQAVLTLGMGIFALQLVARTLSCLSGAPLEKPELGAVSAID